MVQVNDNQMDGIHWVEKYRPKTLDDLVSHKDIVTTSMYQYELPSI